MSEMLLEPGERARTQLRAAIAEVTLNVSSLSHESDRANRPAQASSLSSAWQKLVPMIEPEAEPARRVCPHCQRRIRVQATRCLYCLEKSVASGGNGHG